MQTNHVPVPPLPPAAWYHDPTEEGRLRYWDGSAWTTQVASVATRSGVQLTAKRQSFFGHDMLYVGLGDGTRVGRVNLGTGKVVVERLELQDDFDRAVEAWKAQQVEPGGGTGVRTAVDTGGDTRGDTGGDTGPDKAPPSSTVKTAVEPGWRDLAANRPGQAVRQKALEVKQAAPVTTFFTRLLGMKTDERAWRTGADGEEEVGRHLRRLGEGWRVLHSVVLNEAGSDIDHVVIGPGGIYTLNTKNHSACTVTVYDRAILVNGQKTKYLSKSRAEGNRASALLSAACGFPVRVEPVVVVMCRELEVRGRPGDVHVIGRRDIRKWLQGRPVILDAETVEHIYGVARRDTTWRKRG